MFLAQHWKFALVLGVLGSLLGCKSPVGSMLGGGKSATTSPPAAGALAGAGAASQNPVAKAWKSTTGSVASALTIKPKTIPAEDPVSLDSKPPKISAGTYIATGRLLESRQEFPKAQAEYEKAVKAEPNNLTALISLARLQDRQGQADKAIATYQRAIKAHPKSALVHNDLGLCYARKRDLASAVAMLHKAVEMEPSKPNYRNNLATVLVEAGRTDEAIKQLEAVHPPAVAHYNVAYLLNHRGQSDLAKRHLAQAVQIDPSLTAAHEMLAQLNGGGTAVPAGAAEGPGITASEPAMGQPGVAPSFGAAPQTGPYGPGIPSQTYPPQQEVPVQAAEPVYHIGNEGIETSPAEGPSVSQPTQHLTPAGAPLYSPLGYHLEDSGSEEVLVVTNLVYGKDEDPAPAPKGLVEDEAAEGEESATEPVSQEPSKVKPVSELPKLQPVER